MTAPEPLKAAFKRASEGLPDAGRDVILRSPNGSMRAAARLPLEMMRQIDGDSSSHPDAALFDGDAPPHWWVNESGYLAPVKDDDEWIYEEDYTQSPEEVLEYAADALLKASDTLRELSMGVLERKDGLDRAARVALLRSTDLLAFVASLTGDGLLKPGVEARFRERFPAFDVDHNELVGMYEVRETMKALIASGAVSPFVNMGEPPPVRDEAAELRAAINELLASGGAHGIERRLQLIDNGKGQRDRLEAAYARVCALAASEGQP